MKLKRFLALLLSAVMVTSMLASCSKDGEEVEEEEEEEDKGAIIDMYFGAKPDDLDPTVFTTNSDKYRLTSLLFEGLTTIDEKGKVQKLGASEWKYEIDEREDELKLTIKLAGKKWSDGIAVRADDYVYAWRKILAPSNDNPAAALLYPIKNARKVKTGEVTADIGVSAINDSTIEIFFEDRDADVEYFLRCLASPMLVPLREDKAEKEDWTNQLNYFVTNGPFAVKSMSEDRYMIERSVHYNSLRAGQDLDTYVKPYRIIAHFVDEATAIEMYNSDNIAEKYFFVNEFTKETFEANKKNIDTYSDLTTYTYYFNTRNDILASADTRKALSAALDRNEIAKIRGVGAEAATGLVPTGIKNSGTNDDFRKKAGNVITYTDAKVAKKGSITLTYNQDRPYEKEIAEYAKSKWDALGVKVVLKGVAGNEIDDLIKNEDYDVIGADIVALTDDAFGFVVPFALKSSGTFVDVTTEVYNNPHFTGYENEAVNEIIETALNLTDKKSKDRAKLLMEAEKLIMADAPVAPLFFEKTNIMAAKGLSKFTVDYRGNAVFTEAKLKDYLEINEAKIAAEEAEEATGTAK
ncbi:MAG: hypothetical protein IKU43_02510 [Clostridia bacterium]|nr:hypothetical protein [Clostridia bacterium]